MSTQKIKAIETFYGGYRFRSRLEARWAVFFDAMNMKWEYEPQGYKLMHGQWYLPDFYLPEKDVFVEVKGYVTEETVKTMLRASFSGMRMLLLRDIPNPKSMRVALHNFYRLSKITNEKVIFSSVPTDYEFNIDSPAGGFNMHLFSKIGESNCCIDCESSCVTIKEPSWIKDGVFPHNLKTVFSYRDSYDKARQARFEHGQSG